MIGISLRICLYYAILTTEALAYYKSNTHMYAFFPSAPHFRVWENFLNTLQLEQNY
jgi:hypothetical protein